MGELTFGGSLLKLCEVREIDLTGLHLNAEETSRSALSNVGSKLCRHDNVALRRTSLAQGDLGSQTIAGGSVTVTSCHRLHNGFHTLALPSACGVVVIHAGQHILEREGTVCDAVGSITKAHRKVGCGEAAEEGCHQRGDRTFHTAGSTEQGENEFRLVSDLTKELIQRREEYKCEARIGDLHRDKVKTEESCKLGIIEILDVGIKEVPLLLSLKLNVVSSDAGHQIFPLAIHLLPPCKGEDGFLCGKPCRAFHRVAHVLFHLRDDLKIERGIEMIVKPIHLFKLCGIDLKFGERTTVFVHTSDAVFACQLRAIVDGQLADDLGGKITKPYVEITLLCDMHLAKTSVHLFIRR